MISFYFYPAVCGQNGQPRAPARSPPRPLPTPPEAASGFCMIFTRFQTLSGIHPRNRRIQPSQWGSLVPYSRFRREQMKKTKKKIDEGKGNMCSTCIKGISNGQLPAAHRPCLHPLTFRQPSHHPFHQPNTSTSPPARLQPTSNPP